VGLQNEPGYAWLVPAVVVTATVTACYVRFLAALPRQTRLRFLVAGATYLAGVVGFEGLSGWYSGLYGSRNVTFVTLLTIEETKCCLS
jgi:hypothetical protein